MIKNSSLYWHILIHSVIQISLGIINPSVNLHTDFEIQESGFMLKQNEPWFTASPNSFVSCSCCEKGVIEIKCPLALKYDGLQNAINSGTFYIKRKIESLSWKRHTPIITRSDMRCMCVIYHIVTL